MKYTLIVSYVVVNFSFYTRETPLHSLLQKKKNDEKHKSIKIRSRNRYKIRGKTKCGGRSHLTPINTLLAGSFSLLFLVLNYTIT